MVQNQNKDPSKWFSGHRDRCLWISILMLNKQPTILYFGCKGREMKVLKVDMELIENFKLFRLFCLNLGSILIL